MAYTGLCITQGRVIMFGYSNPSDAAMPYLNQIPGATSQYMMPYYNDGRQVMPQLQGQYNQLTSNPGGKLNDIGQNFQQSPGFNFALQRALQGSNHAAAAGGMAGSPQNQEQNMQIATDMANQDYNNWMRNSLGLYGMGLSGDQDIAHMGFGAGKDMSDMIAHTLAQQANLAYAGKQNENQEKSSFWGNLFGGLGAVAPLIPGIGPALSMGLGAFSGKNQRER